MTKYPANWFCIPPANYLEMLKDWESHMIIAPHVLHNDKYRQFYIDNPDLYTMLDNGLWEGEVVSNAKLLKMANDLHVNEIIAPDDRTTIKTIRKTKSFLRYINKKGQRYDFQIHGALHGENFTQLNNCLNTLLECGVDIIDMPKMLGSVQRRVWGGMVFKKDPKIPVHYLGYYKRELPMLRGQSWAGAGFNLRSFDTSVPFKPKYEEKFNLELPYTWWNRTLIKWRLHSWKRNYRR